MSTRGGGSLVDPKKPTQSNWFRSNPGLVNFSSGGDPHSSTSTTVSSVFDNRATGSTFSTVDSLRDDYAGEPPENKSRFSVLTLDDAPPSNLARHKLKNLGDAFLNKLLRRKIQDSEREVRNGNGVQFTIDFHCDPNPGHNLKILPRDNGNVRDNHL